MDYRKIQLTGEATYTVSLPKKWVQKNSLGKSDFLGIIERGEDLVLRAKEDKESEAEIRIEKKNPELATRMLITKYIQGYDTVTVKSKDYITPELRKALKAATDLLIGMEEFGETGSEVTYKMLMKERGNVEDTVMRMHRMSLSSLEELLDNTGKEKNDAVLRSIIQRDNEIDKFYFLVLRQLSSLGSYEAVMWVQTARIIERISDHIEKIAALVLEGAEIDEKRLAEYRKLLETYAAVKAALANRSIKRADEVISEVKSYGARETDLKAKDHKTLLAHESFRRIGEYVADLAEVTINMS